MAAQSDKPGRWRRMLPWLLMLLGLLSKPSAMVMPALAATVDLIILQTGWRAVARRMWPAAVILPVALAYTKWVQPGAGVTTVAPYLRPLLVGDSLSFYLGKIVWPVGLVFDYTRNPAYVLQTGQLWWRWMIPAAILCGAAWRWRTRPIPLAAFVLFVAGIGPTLGWTTFLFQYYSTVADHYLYIGMLGVALAVAWGIDRAGGRSVWWLPWWIIVLVLAVRSVDQSSVWSDSMALFDQAIRVNPRSFVSLNNRGVLCLRLNDNSKAIEFFNRTVEVNPDYGPAYDHLAITYLSLHDPARSFMYAQRSVEALIRMPPGLITKESLAESCGILAQLYARGRQWDEVDRLVKLSLSYNANSPMGLEARRLLQAERTAAATRPATTPSKTPSTTP